MKNKVKNPFETDFDRKLRRMDNIMGWVKFYGIIVTGGLFMYIWYELCKLV